jgi:hypothetical protein
MKIWLPLILCTVFSVPAFAAEVEAMKSSNARAEAVAQARADARTRGVLADAHQPEAQRSFNAAAASVAEARKAQRVQVPKQHAEAARSLRDARAP